MTKLALLVFIGVVVIIRVLHKPEELSIYAWILGSSLPVITDGYLLAYGRKGFAFRLEYVVFFVGVFIYLFGNLPPSPRYKSNLRIPILLMFFIHLMAFPLAIYWGIPFGIAASIRLVETFIYFFIFVRLTRREHLTKLVHALIGIGAIISVILLVVSISGNTKLYEFIFSYDKPLEATRFYKQFFMGKELPRIWLNKGDESLPFWGVMSLILFVLKKKHRWFYAVLSLLFLVRILVSGQRSLMLIVMLGPVLALLLLIKERRLRLRTSLYLMSAFSSVALLTRISPFNQYYDLILQRASMTSEQMSVDFLYTGTRFALKILSSGGLTAWLFGFSGFIPIEIDVGWNRLDINSPVLMVYRFGIVGLVIVLILLYRTFRLSSQMLKTVHMNPEETAIVIATILYIVIGLVGSMFRGFAFAYTFPSLSGFIILLSWIEVLYRDALSVKSPFKDEKGVAHHARSNDTSPKNLSGHSIL